MHQRWTCDMAEDALMELSVRDLDDAPEPLRGHLASCPRCTERLESVRRSENAMNHALAALRSRRHPDELARRALTISRSERRIWRVRGAPRFALVTAGVSASSAAAAGLMLYLLLRFPTEQPVSVRPAQYQPSLVLASSSLVLVQDDHVVAVLASQR